MPANSPPLPSRADQSPLTWWEKAASIYLFTPLVLFIGGWLRPGLAFPLLALVGASGFILLSRSGGAGFRAPTKSQIRYAAGAALIALAFAVCTGLIHRVPQSSDYSKHNLILGDLIEKPWPVRYETDGGPRYLCYGLGYYLVPAAIAKLSGIASVEIAGFLWGTLGLFLFFHWLGRQFPKHPWLGIGMTLLGGGLAVCWLFIKSGLLVSLLSGGRAPAPSDQLMELGLYTSNLDSFTRFLYQPQHGLAAWLGAALVYEWVMVRDRWTEAAAILAALIFWSPITALGIAVLGGVVAIVRRDGIRFRPFIHLLTALAVTGMLAAYFLPHLPIVEKGFIWSFNSGPAWIIWYLLFSLCFVIVPVSAVAWMEWKNSYLGRLKPVVIAMTVVLLLAPLFKFGQLGDLRMQLSGPAFLFIAIALAKGLIDAPKPRLNPAYLYLATVFAVGAVFPVFRTLDNLIRAPRTDYRIATLRRDHLNSILDLKMAGFDITAQYLGDADARTAGWILAPEPR